MINKFNFCFKISSVTTSFCEGTKVTAEIALNGQQLKKRNEWPTNPQELEKGPCSGPYLTVQIKL